MSTPTPLNPPLSSFPFTSSHPAGIAVPVSSTGQDSVSLAYTPLPAPAGTALELSTVPVPWVKPGSDLSRDWRALSVCTRFMKCLRLLTFRSAEFQGHSV